MTENFSEDEVIAQITRLSRVRLVRFIEAEFVKPDRRGSTYQFRRIDIARLELLCDLSDDLDLNETALGVVMSLLDQLHTARHENTVLARSLSALPDDLRSQIIAAISPP